MRKSKQPKHNICSCGQPAITPTASYCQQCCENNTRSVRILKQMRQEHPDWKDVHPKRWIEWYYDIARRSAAGNFAGTGCLRNAAIIGTGTDQDAV